MAACFFRVLRGGRRCTCRDVSAQIHRAYPVVVRVGASIEVYDVSWKSLGVPPLDRKKTLQEGGGLKMRICDNSRGLRGQDERPA